MKLGELRWSVKDCSLREDIKGDFADECEPIASDDADRGYEPFDRDGMDG